MGRSSRQLPAWRAFGAALGAFAIGAQLLLSGWLIGQVAAAATDQTDFLIVCAHDASATRDGGTAPSPKSHDQCPACACPQSAKLFAPPPAWPNIVVLRPRSQPMQASTSHVPSRHHDHSPYASRAPPASA